MQALREINNLASFKPTAGILFDLYNMVLDAKLKREDAMELFVTKGHANFIQHYKRFKDLALQKLLETNFSELTKVQQQHIDVQKKFTQAKILIGLHKRIAGVQIAEEVIRKAETLGLIEIVLSLSRDLEVHFAVQANSSKKYHHYAQKTSELQQAYLDEFAIMKLNSAFLFATRNKKPLTGIYETLENWQAVATKNQHYRFRLFYHHAINRMADQKGDMSLFIANTNEALQFFDNCATPLPYTTKWIFLINLVPIYLQQKDYKLTEHTLNTCLAFPTKGSYNWHLTLLFKALYGFHTNKPAIALSAWTKAHSVPKKFNSPIITERWLMISGYLAFYHKIGKINCSKYFKISAFLNTIEENKQNENQQANLVILELIYQLARGNKQRFIEKTWRVNKLIITYFNKRAMSRTKYFLRALSCIVDSNFHPAGAQRHADKHLTKLHQYESEMDLSLLDREVVPYELLWGELVEVLGRK